MKYLPLLPFSTILKTLYYWKAINPTLKCGQCNFFQLRNKNKVLKSILFFTRKNKPHQVDKNIFCESINFVEYVH